MLCCRPVVEFEESKLEGPTKNFMELIFSDIMFQQAMQVTTIAVSLMLCLSVCPSACLPACLLVLAVQLCMLHACVPMIGLTSKCNLLLAI